MNYDILEGTLCNKDGEKVCIIGKDVGYKIKDFYEKLFTVVYDWLSENLSFKGYILKNANDLESISYNKIWCTKAYIDISVICTNISNKGISESNTVKRHLKYSLNVLPRNIVDCLNDLVSYLKEVYVLDVHNIYLGLSRCSNFVPITFVSKKNNHIDVDVVEWDGKSTIGIKLSEVYKDTPILESIIKNVNTLIFLLKSVYGIHDIHKVLYNKRSGQLTCHCSGLQKNLVFEAKWQVKNISDGDIISILNDINMDCVNNFGKEIQKLSVSISNGEVLLWY